MERTGKADAPFAHIQGLAVEEHKLLELPSRDAAQHQRLTQIQLELDQCWDLLRRRRVLIETGGRPADAHVRPREGIQQYGG